MNKSVDATRELGTKFNVRSVLLCVGYVGCQADGILHGGGIIIIGGGGGGIIIVPRVDVMKNYEHSKGIFQENPFYI